MTGIFDVIVRMLSSLRFFSIIQPDERGVRLFCGQVTTNLGPGVYWCWPFIGQIKTRSVVEQVVDLRVQSLTTVDGKSVAAGLKLSYKIVNVCKAFYEVWDLDMAVHAEATGHLALSICERTWEECQDREEIQDEILRSMNSKVKHWGVRVVSTTLNDLCLHRCYRIIGDGSGALTS